MAERVGFEPTVRKAYDGFQDRSVMTASVSLRFFAESIIWLLKDTITIMIFCQGLFKKFFIAEKAYTFLRRKANTGLPQCTAAPTMMQLFFCGRSYEITSKAGFVKNRRLWKV